MNLRNNFCKSKYNKMETKFIIRQWPTVQLFNLFLFLCALRVSSREPINVSFSRSGCRCRGCKKGTCRCQGWNCGVSQRFPTLPPSVGDPSCASHVFCCQMNWWVAVRRAQMGVSIWYAVDSALGGHVRAERSRWPGSMARCVRESVALLRRSSAGWMPARIGRMSGDVGPGHLFTIRKASLMTGSMWRVWALRHRKEAQFSAVE